MTRHTEAVLSRHTLAWSDCGCVTSQVPQMHTNTYMLTQCLTVNYLS